MKTIGGGIVEDIECLGKWNQLKKYALKLSLQEKIEDKIDFIIENQSGNPFTAS